MEIIFLILALLALEFPSASIVFLLVAVGVGAWKRRSLGKEIGRLTEQTRLRDEVLSRELYDLKQQIAVGARAAVPAHSPTDTPIPAPAVPSPMRKPAAQVIADPAISEKRTEPERPPQPPPLPEQKPAPPPVPSPVTHRPVPPPVAPLPPPPRTEAPPQPTARVAAPVSVAEYRPTATKTATQTATQTKTTGQQRMKTVFALEEALGTNWLNKLGIVLVVIGIASFGLYELGQLGPAGKVTLSCAVALALLGGGIYLEKQERYRVLGHTLIGGGWSLLFFITYALNHVPAMRVMESENTDLVLMLGVAIVMVIHTLRYRSQLVTGLSFLLAYGTISLSHDDAYSLASGVVLAIGLVSVVIKMGWFELEVFGILATYLTHLYWLYRLLGPEGAQGHPFKDYTASTAILLFYWLIYRISYVVRKIKTPLDEHMSTAAALFNTLLLLGTMKFQSVHPELAFNALLAIGAVEFSFGQLPMTKRRREAFVVLSVLGTALMIAAIPFRYSGNNAAILWLIGAEVFLAAGLLVSETLFRRLGLCVGLLVAGHLAVIDFPPLMAARASSENLLLAPGIMFGLCAMVFYLNVLYLGRRWERFFSDFPDSVLLWAHSYVGAFAAACAAWALCSGEWTAVGLATIMLTLAVLGQKLKSWHLQVQFSILGLLSAGRAVAVNLHIETPPHTHEQARLITLPIIAAAFYLTARWAAATEDSGQQAFRSVFAAAGTALMTAIIYYEVAELWQPFAAIAFAVLLLEVGRWIRYHALSWHAHVLGGLAVLAAVTADPSGSQRWHAIPLHAFGALPVIVGAYWMARRVTLPSQPQNTLGRVVYSWAGSGVMVWVLSEAVPRPWIVVSWIGFALLLALVDRRFDLEELAWQAHALAALTVLRSVVVNLYETDPWFGGISIRTVTLGVVAVALYGLAQIIRVPKKWREQEIQHVYSWAASAIVAALLWYELQPLSVAIGWAVFGLILFEYGHWRRARQFRYQAYVALAAAFGRIFFANLTAGAPGEFWGPRVTTVLPVTLILFFVYAQLRPDDAGSQDDRRWHFDALMAYLGTGTVVALLYFQYQNDWLVTAWAVATFVLIGLAFLLKRPIFLHQALLLTVSTCGRGVFHNLFGASYFSGGDWTGRYFVLGSAIAILLACLPFAFQLRQSPTEEPSSWRWIGALVRRPEQLMFFAPILLLTLMLALKMRAGMVTVAWGIEGLSIVLVALAVKERSYRLTGLILLLLCVAKVLLRDAWGLQRRDQYITFIILGVALWLVSFLYTRYRDTIRQLL